MSFDKLMKGFLIIFVLFGVVWGQQRGENLRANIDPKKPPTNPLFIIDSSGIRPLIIRTKIDSELRKLPYVSKEKAFPGKWNLRIKTNLDNSTIIVEREGFWKVLEVPVTDGAWVDMVFEAVKREARRYAVKTIKNKNSGSKIKIEVRIVPVKSSSDGTSKATPSENDGSKRKDLLEDDLFVFEVRNTGSVDAYVTIADLSPNGEIKRLFPTLDENENRISADRKWYRFPKESVYVITPPYGAESFTVFATPNPKDLEGVFDSGVPSRSSGGPFSELEQYVSTLPESFELAPPEGDWAAETFTIDVGRPRTLHVLSVGIGDYDKNKKLMSPPTENADQEFSTMLEEYGRKVFDRVNVKVLYGEDSNMVNIIAAFRETISQARPQDTFVFQLSGRSRNLAKDGTARIPAGYTDAYMASSTALLRLIPGYLSQIEAKRQFVLLDGGVSTRGTGDLIKRLKDENIEFAGLLERDRWVFTDESIGNEIQEKDKSYGALSLSMIKGMNGLADADSNGTITVGELFNYSKKFIKEKGEQKNQQWKSGNDFVLLENPSKSRKISSNFRSPTRFIPVVFDYSGPGYNAGRKDDAYVNVIPSPSPTPTPTPTGKPETDQLRPPNTIETEPKPRSPADTPVRAETYGPKSQIDYQRKGKDYALLIGTNDYLNWRPLNNPVHDVETIAEELKDYYNFEIDPAQDILRNPTKTDVINAIRRIKARTYEPDDQLFIFFAGHGHYNEMLKEGYLIFSDAPALDKTDDLCPSCDSYFSHSRLRNILNQIGCKHILVVIDACFGGTFDESIKRGEEDPLYESLTNRQMIGRIMQFKTRIFLTSGGKEYVPDGRAGQHSPFARRFLEALRSYGGEYGLLTLNGILSRVERVTPMPRKGQWGDNEPGSDFVFEVRKKP